MWLWLLDTDDTAIVNEKCQQGSVEDVRAAKG